MSNTALWDKLGKTDPAHTKSFTRAGGFKGTAIKPMWSYRRMTEEFGPCGEGWGINEPSFQVVSGENREVLVYCTVSIWYGDSKTVFGVGGDKVVAHIKANEQYKRPERWESDDEAFKKAFTDAITNALKLIGIGADVHMGMFDDNKYVNAVREDFRQNPHVTRPADIVPSTEYDKSGHPVDNIPNPDPEAVQKLRVVDQRPVFEALQKAIHMATSVAQLQQWAADNKNELGKLKADWQEFLRGVYAEHIAALRAQEKGDDMRMAG